MTLWCRLTLLKKNTDNLLLQLVDPTSNTISAFIYIFIYIRILTNWDPKFFTAQKSIARSPLEYVTFDADGRNSGSKYGKAQFT